jgi:DNA-binding HxlR family transcriptional regulator
MERQPPLEATAFDSRPQTSGGSYSGGRSVDESRPVEFRTGARVLSLFSTPLHGLVLRALAGGPMRLSDLRKEVGGPPQTTLRGHLSTLIGMGALEKRRRDGKPSMVDNALTPVGLELLFVADVLEQWLARAPAGALELESEAGKAAIKALISGWNSTMLRALAARPFSLTELDNLITAFTYPALERRLSAMHLAGHVGAIQGDGKGTPYAVTEWLRQGVSPLLASARYERRHLPTETAPLSRIDIEAILLLAIPLVALRRNISGICQLTVESGNDSRWKAAGVRVVVERGKIVTCSSKLELTPPTSIRASAGDWFDAIMDGNSDQLQTDGDRTLALGLVNGLHREFFPPSPRPPQRRSGQSADQRARL